MAGEIQETEVVAMPGSTVVVANTEDATGPVIDWDAAPVVDPAVDLTSEPEVVAVYPAPRGPWDFTDTQRIVLAVLIWLNILMFAVGYLTVTGHLSV